jgi:hypothetical protein
MTERLHLTRHQIGSKMNHVEQNVTNGIVALLKKAVLF